MIHVIGSITLVLFCLLIAYILMTAMFREADERAAEEAAILSAEEKPVDIWEGIDIARRNYRSSLESWMSEEELQEASLRS